MNIGEISYTNIIPLYFYLDRERLKGNGVTITEAVPSRINRLMEEKKVDIGGISSFSFGKNAAHYNLIPDMSVSAFGKVNSIFLFSKFPLEELGGKKIALTSSSETSVALLKIIMQKFYRIEPSFQVEQPHFEKMMEQFDACLLIGDDAISSKRKNRHYHVYDLGEIWYKETGLPMIFAVMAYRKELEKENRGLLAYVAQSMTESKERCLRENFAPLVERVVIEHGGTVSFWESYFTGLNYGFDGEHEKGLSLYFQLAKECGLLQTIPSILKFSYK
ncbi:menaquinone biosynthetic enzyme MqnA/MqnD family protein [Fictibacillus phosphorivorans]|uniref:menaquinone biosynthetic enzyme MqnA/MqnD family protein n=1 Tax=Fictibacillus phosphorivorans TaxID=1221500 RepID=UPI00204203D5|nr:menaquinone biosynthesis protein [Fictibacillus phosphorivorans]MCM3718934.1 menaquinone biosynthesis protein [Fictibacillus phosphorivorans]MCM3776556.1 menaquinone biosynthesis protein [Fictibacillus phosphorivorans]